MLIRTFLSHITAGLRIEALEIEQKEEEQNEEGDSTNEQTISDSEEDAKFVVSDDEAIDQPSDFEVCMNKSETCYVRHSQDHCFNNNMLIPGYVNVCTSIAPGVIIIDPLNDQNSNCTVSPFVEWSYASIFIIF